LSNPNISLPILDELKESRFWRKWKKTAKLKGARAMDSLQGWRYMMRLVQAPKPMEGINEKLLKSRDQKSDQKYLRKP
jgi:hypothetical protein